MTNKITLSRELVEELLDGFLDPRCTIAKAIQAALADPVPPAGGEVEVLSYLYRHPAGEPWPRTYKDRQYGMTDWVETELVDRAHITRLQAEVERLGKRVEEEVATAISNELKSEREVLALKSELTKALELLREASKAPEWSLSVDLQVRISNYLSNQSAPADKGDDDWHMNPCKQGHRDVGAAGGVAHCYTCDEKIEAATTQEAFERWNATHPVEQPAHADKGQGVPVEKLQTHAQPVKWWNGCDSEVPRALRFLANNERPHGGEQRFNAAHLFQLAGEIERMARTPLYAEQPAPVAVVMPERIKHRAENPAGRISYIKGWNACLDEFARLNSVPKP